MMLAAAALALPLSAAQPAKKTAKVKKQNKKEVKASRKWDQEAIKVFQDAKILYAPGKAANAGGVAVSGLEMSQNSERLKWSREEVDAKLHDIMNNIHANCVKYGTENDGYVNYVKGANVAGFLKVAKAMMAQGIV